MATIKQLRLLAARAKEKGASFNWEECKELDNEGVDQEIIRIEGATPTTTTKPTENNLRPSEELNKVRLGLAAKICFNKMKLGFALNNAETTRGRIIQVYDLLQSTETEMQQLLNARSPAIPETKTEEISESKGFADEVA